MWEAPPLSSLQSTLADPQTPIGMRMRATYFLRQEYDNYSKNLEHDSETTTATTTDEKKTTSVIDDDDNDISLAVINTLSKSLSDNRHGSLLRHEFAYVLGQLRDTRAIPALEQTLLNDSDDTMVRHECAEALGAIGSSHSISALEQCANNDTSIEVGETSRLALDYIQWKINGGVEGENTPIACACMLSPYSSVDPAPPHPKHEAMSSVDIGAILVDKSAPLFERFRAMFSLRNRGGGESVKELGNALVTDKSSALLRHEIAYVLGQIQHSDAVEYLEISLKRQNEHRMVRHESAEALGAIEERWGECEAILEQFLNDEDDVVRESCMVALDAADYWGYNGDESVVKENEDGADESKTAERTNFSLHKAETNGKAAQPGVLHNHFNIAAD
ncbi:hypothetical protein ACHAXR_009125 [Thalassiosira sp. AJA248-18]